MMYGNTFFKASAPLPPFPSSMTSEEPSDLPQPPWSKPNAGAPWSREEEKKLMAAYFNGFSIIDMAKSHGRTIEAIRARLLKLGYDPDKR